MARKAGKKKCKTKNRDGLHHRTAHWRLAFLAVDTEIGNKKPM